MNTKAVLAAVAIIIIGAGAYFFMSSSASAPGNGNSTSTPQQASSGSSLSSLVAAGAPVTCTYSTTTPAGTTSGTIYVANGMVAGDFTTTGAQAGTVASHMIVRDNTNYLWTSMSTQGFKSTVTAQQTTQQNQGVDYNAPADYSCQPWAPDSSKFNLPADISFMSTASYTPPSQGAGATGAGSGTQGTAEQCAACNSLTGAQKAQCLAALSC